ncbi:Brefeldin A-inhibited guanine nucleotide-exchange protein 1, partial [Cladochytrium tenue]
LLRNNIGKFAPCSVWPKVAELIRETFRVTTPAELLNCDLGSSPTHMPPRNPSSTLSSSTASLTANLADVCQSVIAEGVRYASEIGKPVTLDSLDFGHTIIKCVTHVEVIQSIRDVALVPIPPYTPQQSDETAQGHAPAIVSMPLSVRYLILNSLYQSYAIARAFNENLELRQAIWRRGLVQQMPNLVRQETISLAAHLQLLLCVYRVEGDIEGDIEGDGDGDGDTRDGTAAENADRATEEGDRARAADGVALLVRDTMDVIERFVVLTADQLHNARDISLWSPVVIMIFRELLAMDGWWTTAATAATAAATNNGDPAVIADGDAVTARGTSAAAPRCLALKRQLPKFFRLGIRMMSVERLDVRQVLQEFMERVGEELFGVFLDGPQRPQA